MGVGGLAADAAISAHALRGMHRTPKPLLYGSNVFATFNQEGLEQER